MRSLSIRVLLVALLCLCASAAHAAPPRKVTVGTYIINVLGVDIKANQFVIDFYVWFRWEGDDLKPLETFDLANGRITQKSGIVRTKLGTQNYALCRVLATITKFWDMQRYPLDGHTLSIEIEDGEADARVLEYERDVDNTAIATGLHVPGWVVRKTMSSVEPHGYHTNYGDTSLPTNQASTYSRYTFSIDVARPGTGRFWKVFFGLFISVMVSWCAFYVRPKESSPRVSLGVGATFAASAVTVTINNSLPDTNSVTLADKLIMLTLGMIVLSVAETIIALTLFARERAATQQKMDRICGIVFPAIYIAILFVFVL